MHIPAFSESLFAGITVFGVNKNGGICYERIVIVAVLLLYKIELIPSEMAVTQLLLEWFLLGLFLQLQFVKCPASCRKAIRGLSSVNADASLSSSSALGVFLRSCRRRYSPWWRTAAAS